MYPDNKTNNDMKKNKTISEKTLWKWFNEFSYKFEFISNEDSVLRFHWKDRFGNVRYVAKIDLRCETFGIYSNDEQNCILMYYTNDTRFVEKPNDMLIDLLECYKKYLENEIAHLKKDLENK